MSIHETGRSLLTDPRWAVNRLDASGVGGFGRRFSIRTAAMMHRHFRTRVADQGGVLVYRRLAPPIPGAAKPTHNVTPERFRMQLAGLLAQGRVFWPLEKIQEFQERRWRVMPWVTAISFDIGFAGIHSYALPILRDLNIPATVFLDTDHFSHETMFPGDDWAKRHHDRSPVEAFRPLNAAECREVTSSGLISWGSRRQLETPLNYDLPSLAQQPSQTSDRRAWQRICVASWDTPCTLTARLTGQGGTRTLVASRALGSSRTQPVEAESPGPPAAAASQRRHPPNRSVAISVIVPTYNRADWICEALASLIDQHTDDLFSYDIHVVDNASSDETAAVVAQVAATSSIEIHYHRRTLPGDAPTRNLGIANSAGMWLAFFDDDQLAEPTWLRELWLATLDGQRPIIGGAVHLHLSEQELATLDPRCRIALREARHYPRIRPYRQRDLPGTGNALVARSVFETLGTFNETMIGGGSDSDFFTRARDAGISLWYTPRAVIRHRVPAERLTPEFLRWDALSGGPRTPSTSIFNAEAWWRC